MCFPPTPTHFPIALSSHILEDGSYKEAAMSAQAFAPLERAGSSLACTGHNTARAPSQDDFEGEREDARASPRFDLALGRRRW